MNWIIKLLLSLVPRETGDDDGGGSPPPLPPEPPPGSRPEWCPEKFWNPDTSEVRAEVLAKGYGELESKLRSKTDDLREEISAERLANAPESYELVAPGEDALKLPEGMKFEDLQLTENDPMVQWFFGFAKEQGLTQDDVNAAVAAYTQMEIDALPNMTDVLGELGDHGQDRLQRVTYGLESRLDDAEAKALMPLLSNADAIKGLEKLLIGKGPGDFDGESGGAPLTLAELRNMQQDERYWKEKDPAFIAKVEKGYQRLYGNQ